MELPRIGDLEIEQDLERQRRSWLAQRIGWVALVAFLIAAGLGVFGGDGPLREAKAGATSAVSYDRFTRFGSPTELEILPSPADVRNAKVDVALDAAYWLDFRVDAVTPEPDAVRAAAGQIVYTFLSSAEPEQVSFRITPLESGVQRGRVRIGGGETVEFTQLIYP